MITVKDAMNIGGLRMSKVVAGENGLSNAIKYVTVMEVPDITKWLKGNDFLITSFYAVKDDIEAQAALIRELAKIGSAGIAIKTDRFIKDIPEAVKAVGNELSFPIIEIPRDVTYIDIITPLMEAVLDDERKERTVEEFTEEIVFHTYRNRENIIDRGKTLGYDMERGYFYPFSIDIDDFESIARKAEYDECRLKKIKDDIYYRVSDVLVPLGHPYLLFRRSDSISFFIQCNPDSIFRSSKIAQRVKSNIEDLSVTIGIGEAGTGPDGIENGYSTARAAIKLGRTLKGKNNIYDYKDLGIFGILYGSLHGQADEILDATIGPIISDGVLLETLARYFECNENHEATSKSLFIHTNTLRYRLGRISELTGLNFKNIDDKVKLYLGIMAYKMLRDTK